MATTATPAVAAAEVATLRAVALAGALDAGVRLTCADLADRIDASNQTASRRLQTLEDAGLVERRVGGDGQRVAITDDGERVLRREYEAYRRLFADDRVTLEGSVTDGMGEGRHYITLPGYMEQFRDRLGYEPFPGTLNVDLVPGSARRRGALDAVDAIPIDGWEDDERTYGPARCYAATVATESAVYEDAHLIEPERTHHDDDHVEVIAPDRLRDELELNDADHVRIHVGGA